MFEIHLILSRTLSMLISLSGRHRELISNQLYNLLRFTLASLIALLTLKLVTTYLSQELSRYRKIID